MTVWKMYLLSNMAILGIPVSMLVFGCVAILQVMEPKKVDRNYIIILQCPRKLGSMVSMQLFGYFTPIHPNHLQCRLYVQPIDSS